MSRKYLAQHPQIFKKLTYQSQLRQPLQINQQETTNKLISQKKNSIERLMEKVRSLKRQNSLMQETLQSYDADVQKKLFQKQLKSIKKQQEEISQQIKNCQIVQQSTTADQYFIWKKKRRIQLFESKVTQLHLENQMQKKQLTQKYNLFVDNIEQLQSCIEKLEKDINHISQLSFEPVKPFTGKQISEQDLASMIQQQNQLKTTNDIMKQSKQILLKQLKDNTQSLKNSLDSYYQNTRTKLIKDLKKIKEETMQQEISPVSVNDKVYSIENLINDYHTKMKTIKQSLPENIKNIAEDLFIPLDWKSFDYDNFIEDQKPNIRSFQEYRRIEEQCLENQTQIKHIKNKEKQIQQQIISFEKKSLQLTKQIKELQKILKKKKKK